MHFRLRCLIHLPARGRYTSFGIEPRVNGFTPPTRSSLKAMSSKPIRSAWSGLIRCGSSETCWLAAISVRPQGEKPGIDDHGNRQQSSCLLIAAAGQPALGQPAADPADEQARAETGDVRGDVGPFAADAGKRQ